MSTPSACSYENDNSKLRRIPLKYLSSYLGFRNDEFNQFIVTKDTLKYFTLSKRFLELTFEPRKPNTWDSEVSKWCHHEYYQPSPQWEDEDDFYENNLSCVEPSELSHLILLVALNGHILKRLQFLFVLLIMTYIMILYELSKLLQVRITLSIYYDIDISKEVLWLIGCNFLSLHQYLPFPKMDKIKHLFFL